MPISKAWSISGKAPIKVRWVDISKGDDICAQHRSRLVAKEIKTYRDDTRFAATPPWETVKMLFSLAVTNGFGFDNNPREGKCIDHVDIRRAYFNVPSHRSVFVDLHPEDHEDGE